MWIWRASLFNSEKKIADLLTFPFSFKKACSGLVEGKHCSWAVATMTHNNALRWAVCTCQLCTHYLFSHMPLPQTNSKYTNRHKQITVKDNRLLLQSTSFHSGVSRPGQPGLQPLTAYATGKRNHLGHMQPHTHTHSRHTYKLCD